MRRSKTLDAPQKSPQSDDSKDSRRKRWSFAIRRALFSHLSSSKSHSLTHHDSSRDEEDTPPPTHTSASDLISPKRTYLGHIPDGSSASCSTDRPVVSGSSSPTQQNIVKRKSIRYVLYLLF
ncbi:hypothetical protein AB6A40_002424 [Gnathostoma spinigerum]|uniref:Uncharacterized protein n=1 Tax=Gnathostoma spinigerum TaxID=75299 RepID=A0ABD6E7Q1_9BILA